MKLEKFLKVIVLATCFYDFTSEGLFLSIVSFILILLGFALMKRNHVINLLFLGVMLFVNLRYLWLYLDPNTFGYFFRFSYPDELHNTLRLKSIVYILIFLVPFRFVNTELHLTAGKLNNTRLFFLIFTLASFVQYVILGKGMLGVDSRNYLKVLFPEFLILYIVFSEKPSKKVFYLFVILYLSMTIANLSKAGIFKFILAGLLFSAPWFLKRNISKYVVPFVAYSLIAVLFYNGIRQLRHKVRFGDTLDAVPISLVLGQTASRINIVDGFVSSTVVSDSERSKIRQTLAPGSKYSSGKLLGLYISGVPLDVTHGTSVGILGFVNILSPSYGYILLLCLALFTIMLHAIAVNLLPHKFSSVLNFFLVFNIINFLLEGNLDYQIKIMIYSYILIYLYSFLLNYKFVFNLAKLEK